MTFGGTGGVAVERVSVPVCTEKALAGSTVPPKNTQWAAVRMIVGAITVPVHAWNAVPLVDA